MIIVGCCASGDGEKFEAIARPFLTMALRPEDRVIVVTRASSICSAYNSILEQARSEPECQAVVLIHDDVEIHDRQFREKVIGAAALPDAGVVGVVGAVGLTGAKGWEARQRFGRALDTTGALEFGPPNASVDAVDGLMLILAPAAFRTVNFDADTFPGYHGYDLGYCLQVKSEGLCVLVRPFDIYHRTKVGYGDESAFEAAGHSLKLTWPAMVRPLSKRERVARLSSRTQHIAMSKLKGAVREARDRRSAGSSLIQIPKRSRSDLPAPLSEAQKSPRRIQLTTGDRRCPCCRTEVPGTSGQPGPVLLRCLGCRTVLIDPPPARIVEGDGIFQES